MKTISLIAGTLGTLAFSAIQAQEARVEQVTIYENVKGNVYLNETFFINENASPVHITDVVVRHIPRETAELADAYWDSLFQYLDDQKKENLQSLAKEKLTITINARGDNVVAVKFGVIVYDAFNEYLGGLTAITMDPPTTSMKWNYNPPYLFKFEKYGIVGIYVRQARLKNGGIWNFDENFVTNEFSGKLGEITKEQISGSEN